MSMPIGILILHNKTIEFINPMLVAILGLGNEDNLLGKELTDVLPETSWIAFNEKLEEFGYNMTSDRFQSGFENALGNYIFLQMRFISTTFNGKHSVMVTTNDVSNQRYTEQVLLHEKQKAQESDRLKFNFIANLSHEVRTPVNAIMGFGQLIEQELDMPRDLVNEYLQIIVQSSRELVQTIDNLVEVSEAFTNSADSTEYTPFSVSDLFMQLETQYKHKNSKLEFKIEYPPRQTGTLLSDFDKLKKIISTLIDNSFKFTTKGFVRVYYCEDDNLQVISVEDSGIGIHEEQQKRIFELFQQGELNSDNRQYGGTGTGLFLANLLARILGIRIELKSEIGKGSVFSLIMRKSEYFGYHSNESSSDSDTLLANKMVLIVEDSLANTLLLEELVANLGGSSHAVYTGRDAIEYIAKDKPCDLILLDIQMPDIDGYAVFNKVRTLRHMPIIAQTAYALNSDKDKAAKLGFDGYLTKPIDFDDFEAVIRKAIQ
jgi:signal transduction histidine kinase